MMIKTANRGSFRKGGNRLAKCRSCGKLTHSDIDGCIDIQLCADCYEESGLENEHSDGYHDEEPNPRCPECKAKR